MKLKINSYARSKEILNNINNEVHEKANNKSRNVRRHGFSRVTENIYKPIIPTLSLLPTFRNNRKKQNIVAWSNETIYFWVGWANETIYLWLC